MGETHDRECYRDDCPGEGGWEIAEHPGVFLCDNHRDQYEMDRHVWVRRWRADDSFTRATGDPGEATHGGGAA
ncbi:hypothetical protein [Streptomyces sp. NBC_01497]|uniref:hypothetical protein n=1 Tax=Streptomyces sp. NBC_01497 TaxID=2903885 RepID=UPI002E32F4B5|nr:hypothetical protein [Streptomyces sp. NBC_01497]